MNLNYRTLVKYNACYTWASKWQEKYGASDVELSTPDDWKALIADGFAPVLSWAYWMIGPTYRINLSGADLHEADLSGANLRGADLSGAL